MAALTQSEINSLLNSLTNWRIDGGKLTRNWKFKNFREAMSFVNQVAEVAELHGHHPDIDIRYNEVRLGLISHDAGGITQRDAKMATEFDNRFH